ncbi:MAG: hypothetical protein U5K30_02430 [Acidimicrobiales bacterium]|nr:hypothetical protein [Acidimicrobiales bacterium]
MTLLADVVATSARVAGTTKRTEKKAALAELLGDLDPDEVEVVVGFLTGEVRQGRIGIGWATIRDLEVPHADEATLTVADVDTAVDRLQATTGARSRPATTSSPTCSVGRLRRGDFLGRLFVASSAPAPGGRGHRRHRVASG